MKNAVLLSMAVMAASAVSDALAGTLYVDAANYGRSDTVLDGKTEATAFGTIQEAVDAAASGDTILVAEGVYDQGSVGPDYYGFSRVKISGKKIYLKAAGAADRTVIKGEASTADDAVFGCGAGAVRCILVQEALASESIIEGFTLKDGFTALSAPSDNSPAAKSGGAVCSAKTTWVVNDNGPYLVNCIVDNCAGHRSGIGCGGVFIRSRIQNCRVNPSGNFCWRTKFLHSTITHNTSLLADGSGRATAHFDQSMAVNCTFADNYCIFYPTTTSYVYNNIVSGSSVPIGGADGYYEDNFTDSVSARVLMGSATGDARLRSGCVDTAKTADAKWIAEVSLPSGEAPWNIDAYVDYFGNAVAKEGTIAAGCSQGEGKGVAAPAGGAVVFDIARLSLDPVRPSYEKTYFHPDAYPVNVRVYANLAAGTRVLRWSNTLSGTEGATYIPPLLGANDPVDVIPPPDASTVLTLSPETTSVIKYVDPGLEDYSAADGSEENPFMTIQEAIDASTGSMPLIVCKAGVYGDEQGGRESDFNGTTGTVRFVSSLNKYRILAESGPKNTFIIGKRDATTANGCGAGAICAFAVKGTCVVQGFTVTGSYSSFKNGSGGFWTFGRGGALYTYGLESWISDCVFSNNVGTSAAVGCGRYFRCRMHNNTGTDCVVGQSANLYACVIAGNTVGSGNSAVWQNAYDYTYYSFHVTIAEDDVGYPFYPHGIVRRENCVVDGGYATPSDENQYGSLYYGFSYYYGSNYLIANPMLADKNAFDLRLAKVSPGVSAARAPAASDLWWRSCTSDVNGNPIAFDASGRPLPGAYASAADGVFLVEPEHGGVVFSGIEEGLNTLSEDAVATFSAVAGTRPCAGMVVNGVTNLFESAENHVIEVALAENTAIEPYYTSDWYAAVDGDDSATGFYPSAAKTLKGALENASLQRGDRVLACAGVYEGETMLEKGCVYVRSRAIVPRGVTLEGVDGRDVTIIKGKAATVEDEDCPEGWGLGEDAVRCVILRNGSRLKGFTLRDGHTRSVLGDDAISSDRHGGQETSGGGVGSYNITVDGVTDYNRNAAWVEDCIIENCAAYRGGGVMAVNAKNCIFRNNRSVNIGAGISDSSLYGCYSALNESRAPYTNGKGVGFLYYAENCTFLDGVSTCGIYGTPAMVNCFVSGPFDVSTVPQENVTNSVFVSDKVSGITAEWLAAVAQNGSFAALAAELELDGEGRPVIGSNVAVDRGEATANTQSYLVDAGGSQRIYNGTMDIGAMEADWRPIYAKTLAKTRFSVSAATENVVRGENAASVTVPAGERLEAVWKGSRSGGDTTYFITAKIDEGASLRVYLNGVDLGAVPGDGTKKTLSLANDLAENALVFACEGEAGAVELSSFSRSPDSAIMFVR